MDDTKILENGLVFEQFSRTTSLYRYYLYDLSIMIDGLPSIDTLLIVMTMIRQDGKQNAREQFRVKDLVKQRVLLYRHQAILD